MQKFAFLVVLTLAMGAIVALFQWAGVEFVLGVLFGSAVFHVSYRLQYGDWFYPLD